MFVAVFALINLMLRYVCALSPLLTDKPLTYGFGLTMHFTHPSVGKMEMIRAANFKCVRTDL